MTRNVLRGLAALGLVSTIAVLPSSCQSGGIGDPCTPEDEYQGTFAGFQVSQENIESRSFQCESRICLVNHFQGRVSCPMGQPAKTPCIFDPNSAAGSCTGEGEACVVSSTFAPSCPDNSACENYGSETCNAEGYCECAVNEDCPENHVYDADTKQCKLYVCHVANNCQSPDASDEENDGKDCCLPGTDIPVAAEVCGQCGEQGFRDAPNSVYCSCRCGVAEGQPEDENFNFCECPDGFACVEVRPDVGLGDPQLSGKYCVKNNDPIVEEGAVVVEKAAENCGGVNGHFGQNCVGLAQ